MPKYYKYFDCTDGKQYETGRWYRTLGDIKPPYSGIKVCDSKRLLYNYGKTLAEVVIRGDTYKRHFNLYTRAFQAIKLTYMTDERWFLFANDCMWRFYKRHTNVMENWVSELLKTITENPGVDVISNSPLKKLIQDITLNFTEETTTQCGDELFYLLCAISRFGTGEIGFFANHALACLYEIDNHDQWYSERLVQYLEKELPSTM